MSDFISRSELIDALKVHFDSCFREDGELLYSDHICTSDDVVDLIKLVQNQPTAYDIEKIVKALEKKANNCQSNVKYYGEKAEWMSKAYRDAIEVVKGGIG